MPRRFAAALRRMTKLMRPGKLVKSTRSVQQAMTGFMVQSTLASMAMAGPFPSEQGITPGKMTRSAERGDAPRTPTGAQYLTRTHRTDWGSRGFKLYLPKTKANKPIGLVLMLHGCSQTPNDFALGTHMNALAEKHGLAIAYPAQTGDHNAASCWNWFQPGDQHRGAGEPALLASLTRKLMKEFELGREDVFVAGLSAGGAMAAILADVYPDVFSAAGIHSGLARGAASGVLTAMSAMRSGGTSEGEASMDAASATPVRWIIFQGDADTTVHPSNASMLVESVLGDNATPIKVGNRTVRGRGYARSDFAGADGTVLVELWMIEGTGHAWSGGRATGSFTDSKGPDASAEMIRFFMTKHA